MVSSLVRTDARMTISNGDGYVLEYAAANATTTQASLSACFTTVRDTFDATGQMVTTSSDSTHEAYELAQANGVWLVTNHRALGLC